MPIVTEEPQAAITPPSKILEQINTAREIAEFCEILCDEDGAHEVRVPNCPDRIGSTYSATAAGYFNNPQKVAAEVLRVDRECRPPAFYITLNPCESSLLSRSFNVIKPRQRALTTDADITSRRWLFVDIDPIRKPGIQSTDEETEETRKTCRAIQACLREIGWPEPLVCMSGNGHYLLYRVQLPNDQDSTLLVKRVLEALATQFDTAAVKVDTSTHNAARICKLIGTVSRKGDEYPGTPRPHRKSFYERPCGPLRPVPLNLLTAVAQQYSEPQTDRETASSLDKPKSGLLGRVRSYISKMDSAISGQDGSRKTLEVACVLGRFGLDKESAMPLFEEFNLRCEPRWSPAELAHKLEDGYKKVRDAGEFGSLATPRSTAETLKPAGIALCNYVIDVDKNVIPIPVEAIAKEITRRLNGFPKRVKGDLIARSGTDLYYLTTAAAMFSYMRERFEVDWRTGANLLTKDELLEVLKRHSEPYEEVSTRPHFPTPIPGIYYACEQPKPTSGRRLAELLDLFSPATPIDLQLIHAAIVTPFWNGAPGQRPGFALSSLGGQGKGKTTTAQVIGRIAGGLVEIGQKADNDEVKTRLLSPGADDKWAVLLDNIKSSRYSDGAFEALVTASLISGHRMYHGEASRKNYLTFLLTMNGPSFSRDIAQRFINIVLGEPVYEGDWAARVDRLITDHRDEIISDIAGFFCRPKATLDQLGRWGAWQSEVLSRLENPQEVAEVIRQRESENDADRVAASDIEEHVYAQLEALGFVKPFAVHIPLDQLGKWVSAALGEPTTGRIASQMLDRFESSGLLYCLSRNPSKKESRGFVWRSPNCSTPVEYKGKEFWSRLYF